LYKYIEIEININVKLSNLEPSSSQLISVLIKHERNNVSVITNTPPTVVTSIPSTLNSTTLQYPWLTDSTNESFNTTAFPIWQTTFPDSWSINDTTEFPIWEYNFTNSSFINTTIISPINTTDTTNPWWLDWWLEIPTNSSISS
jgi:hypothetical protein